MFISSFFCGGYVKGQVEGGKDGDRCLLGRVPSHSLLPAPLVVVVSKIAFFFHTSFSTSEEQAKGAPLIAFQTAF